jgi:hypothetical protein
MRKMSFYCFEGLMFLGTLSAFLIFSLTASATSCVPLYFATVDVEKAYDTIAQSKLYEILERAIDYVCFYLLF